MSVRDFSPGITVSGPRGGWISLANRRTGTAQRASAIQNMRVRYGTVHTRPGTTRVFDSVDKVTGMFNWIEPDGTNLVFYQDGSSINTYLQATDTKATILTGLTTTRAPSFAPLDVWTYFSGFDTSGNGTIQARVFDGVNLDKAFRGSPTINGWTAVDAGPGQCTAGQHFIGFVYQNRTGYAGIPVTAVVYPITATSNANPDVITAPGNNLQTGQQVTIAGALGDTAINGQRIVTVVTPGSTFTLTDTALTPIAGNGAHTGGGTVSNPIQVTLNAGLRQINVSVDFPAQPDGGTDAKGKVQATLFLIATRSDNPAIWYFIPSDPQTGQIGEQPVPLNTPVTLNFVFSLSDEDIATSLSGDTAQANFLFTAQDADGNGPFNPDFVVAYGNRMCYGNGTVLWVSDIGFPQQIGADTNQVRMQNQKKIAVAFQLPGNTNIYLTGDFWTGYTTDNNDSPSTWPQPIGVSDALGAKFPNLVCAATGGNWAWIVTEGGPYLFDGAYGLMPLTYLFAGKDINQQPIGWSRVNWNAAYAIQVQDDVKNLKLYIAAPLDGATECTHLFCIDYRQGKTFETCDISLDKFAWGNFSSIAVVKEYSTGLSNLWTGPAAAGSVVRFNPDDHNDLGQAIDGYWKSGLAKGKNITSAMVRVGAMDIWAHGNAPLVNGVPTFLVTLFGPDNVQSVLVTLLSHQGIPAALTEAPGLTYMSKFDISKINDWQVEFRTNSVGAYFELSSFRGYEKADLFNR